MSKKIAMGDFYWLDGELANNQRIQRPEYTLSRSSDKIVSDETDDESTNEVVHGRRISQRETAVTILPEGSIRVQGDKVVIPNLSVRSKIAARANGTVFLANHKYLDRIVALKIWMPNRIHDRRDKFEQGLAEARKAALAESEHVTRLHDAGRAGRFTMRSWISMTA